MNKIDIINWIDSKQYLQPWMSFSDEIKNENFCRLFYFTHVEDKENLKFLTIKDLSDKRAVESILKKNPFVLRMICENVELTTFHKEYLSEYKNYLISVQSPFYAALDDDIFKKKIKSFSDYKNICEFLKKHYKLHSKHLLENIHYLDNSFKFNPDVIIDLLNQYINNTFSYNFQGSVTVGHNDLKNLNLKNIFKTFQNEMDICKKLIQINTVLYDFLPNKIKSEEEIVKMIWFDKNANKITRDYLNNSKNTDYIKNNFDDIGKDYIKKMKLQSSYQDHECILKSEIIPNLHDDIFDDVFINKNIKFIRECYNYLSPEIQNKSYLLMRLFDVQENEKFNNFSKTHLKKIQDEDLRNKMIQVKENNSGNFEKFKIILEEHFINATLDVNLSKNKTYQVKKL